MKKAFTLVELIIVVGIICVLAGILLASFSGGTDSAKAALCLANMKNLANACQTYGMATYRYPNAGSEEYLTIDESQGRRNVRESYSEIKGWISWDSEGHYPSSSHQSNPTIGLYETDRKKADYALTNGCLWKYVSQNRSTYVCPLHQQTMRRQGLTPNWSYLMNAYFGWDTSEGARAVSRGSYTDYGTLQRADRRLLFAEVPFMGYSSWQPEGSAGSKDTDGVLQFATTGLSSGDKGANGSDGEETIGANHMVGKKLYAHVAFADGHVEKLRIPYTGSPKNPKADENELKQLTAWLCAGYDVSLSGNQYQKLEN
ncbi:MAG: type II secretion system protein [Kiritimatiellia bacterium]